MTESATDEVGTFCLVLHSHLPWLAHHGSWPVGEEWLYQSWATSYLPVFEVLNRLAEEGRQNLVTLGMTPVLAAQLDDPYCLANFHTWLGFWHERAHQLATDPNGQLREVAGHEAALARRANGLFETHWRNGGSAVLRPLLDGNAVQLLGGPATHPFQPLLDDEVAAFALDAGLADAKSRVGQAPQGIWAPECGYRPGLEATYAAAGVGHFMVDGPTLLHVGRSTADAWTVGDSDVVAFGRDLEVTYRVWSPRRGYPGGPWYRDFHTFHHETGIRHARVTSTSTHSDDKQHYDPDRVQAAVAADAADFVQVVRQRLADLREQRDGKTGLVVAAYDTELFGHWWHEGPQWLEQVLRLLPAAGVRVTTLADAINRGAVAGKADPQNSSWGSNKDWSVWAGDAVASFVTDNDALQRRWRKLTGDLLGSAGDFSTRDPALDQLARSALLALSSDWAFMVTKDSAAGYASDRHRAHHADFHRLASALEHCLDGDAGARQTALDIASHLRLSDGPFGQLDGRLLHSAS